jgi:hypothetical protein
VSLSLKSHLFYATYMVGGLVLGALSFQRFGVLPVFVWFLAFGILQFVLLRCPTCGALGIRRNRGAYVPWTGTACRFCGKPY